MLIILVRIGAVFFGLVPWNALFDEVEKKEAECVDVSLFGVVLDVMGFVSLELIIRIVKGFC